MYSVANRNGDHTASCSPTTRLLPFPQVFASALATWQLGVINAPTNKGLKPKKFNFYDLDHYYQVGRSVQLALQVARRAGGKMSRAAGLR